MVRTVNMSSVEMRDIEFYDPQVDGWYTSKNKKPKIVKSIRTKKVSVKVVISRPVVKVTNGKSLLS